QPGTTVPVRTVIAHLGSGVSGPGPARGSATSVAPARQFASPRARMRARERGIDLNALRGTGPNGRIVEADVLASAPSWPPRVAARPMARRLAEENGVSLETVQGSGPGGRITHEDVARAAGGGRDVEPLSRVRKLTAERMAASAQATARVTLFLEADFSE